MEYIMPSKVSGFQHLPQMTYKVTGFNEKENFCQVTSITQWSGCQRLIGAIAALALLIFYPCSMKVQHLTKMSLLGKVTYRVRLDGDTPNYIPDGQVNGGDLLRLSRKDIFAIAKVGANHVSHTKGGLFITVGPYSYERPSRSLNDQNKGLIFKLGEDLDCTQEMVEHSTCPYTFWLIPESVRMLKNKQIKSIALEALKQSDINRMWFPEGLFQV
jgi:hypothetical protein